MEVQGVFFKSVLMDYLEPLKVVWAFFDVLMELPREILLSVFMESSEYEVLQEFKLTDEVYELMKDLDPEFYSKLGEELEGK